MHFFKCMAKKTKNKTSWFWLYCQNLDFILKGHDNKNLKLRITKLKKKKNFPQTFFFSSITLILLCTEQFLSAILLLCLFLPLLRMTNLNPFPAQPSSLSIYSPATFLPLQTSLLPFSQILAPLFISCPIFSCPIQFKDGILGTQNEHITVCCPLLRQPGSRCFVLLTTLSFPWCPAISLWQQRRAKRGSINLMTWSQAQYCFKKTHTLEWCTCGVRLNPILPFTPPAIRSFLHI